MDQRGPANTGEAALSRLASKLLVRHAAGVASPARRCGVVLFFDISAFTPLTTRYAAQGPAGLEALSELINRYFAALLQPVHENGGDVLAFFGDAVLVLFAQDGPGQVTQGLMTRALACALTARESCHHYPTGEPEHALGLKITVGAGTFEVSEVHAPGTARHVVVYGDAIRQIGKLEPSGVPGEIVLSQQALEQCPNLMFECRARGNDAVLVRSLRELPVPALPDGTGAHVPADLIRPYIDARVADRVCAVDFAWLAEFRTISSLFIHVQLSNGDAGSPEAFQQLFSAVATRIATFAGSILSFAVEDKGIVFSCAFGMPGMAAGNIADQCVQAGLQSMHAVRALGHQVYAGCAIGRQYCGPIGDDKRIAIALLGEVVNLAARFAGIHSRQLVCDQATADTARARGRQVVPLPPFILKGIRDPVPAFVCRSTSAAPQPDAGMVGRDRERRVLSQAIDALRGGTQRCILITGEAGVGKSALLACARAYAVSTGVVVIDGAAGEAAREIPYNAWRSVIRKIIAEPFPTTPAALAARIRDEWPERILEGLPLLSEIAGLACPDNESTRELAGPARIRATRRLMIDMLSIHATRAPLVILLEDAHWLDSASWTLLEELRQSASPLLLVISLRSGEPIDDPTYRRLRRVNSLQPMHLDVLSREETRALLEHWLAGVQVSDELVDTLYRRTDGHPFFTEELFYTLRDGGALVVQDGRCRLRAAGDEARRLEATESISAVITNRLTRLGAMEQLILKIASAIGDSVSIPLWRSVAIAVGIRKEISDSIAALCDLEFMREVAHGEVVAFKHAITRGVVYGMLTYAQRQTIHGAIVRSYEVAHDGNSGTMAAVIAAHCANAMMIPAAVDRYEAASGLALSSGAYREAVSHVASAQALTHEHGIALDPLRLARWERLRGEAEFQRGHIGQSRQHFEKALVLLGRSGADSMVRMYWDVTACSIRHLLRRTAGSRRLECAPDRCDDTHMDADTLSALLHERLARVHYFASDSLALARQALLCLDVCERLPASLELAKSYAGAALLTSFSPALAGLSRGYAHRARQVAGALGRRSAIGEVELILATVAVGNAQWEEAASSIDTALTIFQRLNETQSLGHCKALLLESWMYQGRLLDARRDMHQLRELGASGNLQLDTWAVVLDTWVDRRLGAFDRLVELDGTLDSARLSQVSRAEPVVIGTARANIAYALARTGEWDRAERLVAAVFESIRVRSSPGFFTVELWQPLVETLLLLWQQAGGATGERLYRDRVMACVRSLRALAGRHRVARPAYLLNSGMVRLHTGQRRRAVRLLRKSAALADRLEMPYEAAQAYAELAEAEHDGARRELAATCAAQRFERSGATALPVRSS